MSGNWSPLRLIWFSVIALLLAGHGVVAADDQGPNWFTLQSPATINWELTYDATEPMRFEIAVRNPVTLAGTPKEIVLLFTKESSSYNTAIAELLNVFYNKQMNARFTAINFENDEARGLAALEFVRSEGADLVFSVGSDATDFIFHHFRGESIPALSITSKDPVLLGYLKDYETGSGSNIAYTSLNVPIELQMTYLKQLVPDLANIIVLYADSNSSAKQTQVEPLRSIARSFNIRIIDVVVYDDSRAVQELRDGLPVAIETAAETDPDYQNSILWITGSTSVFNEIETINEVAGPIPVLSAVPDVVQEGTDSAVISIGVTFESNAHVAALYALSILKGETAPGDLPAGVVTPPDIAINFGKARELDLRIPFSFFESATYIYDYDGRLVREDGQPVTGQAG
jgi:putative ABC transport system substrate-binding protein